MPKKECRSCHFNLPLDEFRLVDSRTGRRRSWCRGCEAANKAEKRQADQAKRLGNLASNANRLFAAGAYHEFSRAVAETARAFGGAAGFGKAFWETHRRAKKAGDHRAALRLQRLLLQAFMWHSRLAELTSSEALSTASDEELERFIEDRIEALAAIRRGD